MTQPTDEPAEDPAAGLDRQILAAIRALADARRAGDRQAAETARGELAALEAQRG